MMSIEEETTKCGKIHDILAEHWNWAYYDTPHGQTSWLLAEYVERLKVDVEKRVPVILNEIEEIAKARKEGTVSLLDVGCGVGGVLHKSEVLFSESFPELKLKATGIDISKSMVDYAIENLSNTDFELVCDSITNRELVFENEPFDIAIVMVTLSFYNDSGASEILESIRDKLSRGGKLLILDFAWSYMWSGYNLFSKPLQKITDTFFSHLLGESFHFNNRTEEELVNLVTDAGFEVERAYLTEDKSKMKGMLVIRARA
jgi:SAM-dependent methyltransferase